MVYSKAEAIVKGEGKTENLKGKVTFYQIADGVLLESEILGLPNDNTSGFFGFHIHEGKECDGKNFENTLSHYNPKNTSHPYHAGDLPPLLSFDGKAYMSVITNRFNVDEIIGKTVVIHSKADDFTTQPSGNSGEKIACGVIERI